MLRIKVDFNTMMADAQERIRLARTDETRQRNTGLLAILPPVQCCILYDGTTEVEAMVEYDAAARTWFAVPNWTTRRDILEAEVSQWVRDMTDRVAQKHERGVHYLGDT